MAVARSGVSSSRLPSMCERKVTPASVIRFARGEAEDLEAARIGQDRPVPAHEAVQAARRGHDSSPGRRARWKVLARIIRVPVATSWSGVSPLTVAWVPTGMKAGVSTVPCGVSSRPRARPSPGRGRAGESDRRRVGAGSGVRMSRVDPRSPGRRKAADRAGPPIRSARSTRPQAGQSFFSLRPMPGELVADLVERGDAEVLALQQLVAGVLEQVAQGLDVELAHALAGPDRQVEVADRLGQHGLHLGRDFLRRLDPVIVAALAAFQGHAQPQALGLHHLLDLGQRRLAEVLAREQRGLGGPGQVAERADIHLPQAVAAADRQLEVGDRDLVELLEDGVAPLGFLVVVHPLAGLAILDEEPGAGVVGVVGEDLAVALLGLAEPHLILVEDAEVDPGGQRHGRPLGASPVVIDGDVVIAVDVVDVGQLEQGAVVVPVEAEGLLELGGGLGHLAVGGEQAAAAGSGIRPTSRCASAVAGRIFLASVELAGAPQRAGAVQLGVLGVVAQLVRPARTPRRPARTAAGSPGPGRGRSRPCRPRRPSSGAPGPSCTGPAAPRRRPAGGGPRAWTPSPSARAPGCWPRPRAASGIATDRD